MTISFQPGLAGAVAFAALLVCAPAQADPTAIGSFKDWSVYSGGSGADRTCYTLSQPKSSEPKGAKRDPIFFLISSWPVHNVVNEPSVVPGYPYKDGSKVSVEIGSDKFQFFTKNDGTAGGAWMENPADEKKMIDAIKRGQDMAVTGTSMRGTLTRDQYSLAGISAALDKVAASCK